MSTQIKTPAEIADDLLAENLANACCGGHCENAPTAGLTDEELAGWMTAAIEADRAQRAAIPYSLIDAVGADFQDGEALWFYPSEQVPGRFDAVIYHANSEHLVRYSYDGPTGIVTVTA